MSMDDDEVLAALDYPTDVTNGVWAGEYLNRPAKSYAQASRQPIARVQAEQRKANG